MKTLLPLLFSLALLNVNAQVGSLDLSYGVNGIRVFNPSPTVASPYKLIPLASGGYYQVTQIDADFVAAVKYTPAGTIDISYGTAGYSQSIPIRLSTAVAQTDGKLVLVGITNENYYPDFHHDVMIVRFTAGGALDASFYSGGIQYESATLSSYDDVKNVVLENNILVVGVSSASLVGGFVVNHFYKYDLAAGTRTDVSLGALIPIENWYAEDFEYFFAVQGTKVVVLSRGVDYSDFSSYQTLGRYNADGTPDISFGSGGSIALDQTFFRGNIRIKALADKILLVFAAPSPATGNIGLALARFNNDGSPDLTFNGTGRIFREFAAGVSPVPVAIEANNDRFILGGYVQNAAGTRFFLNRYNANGSLDNSFDTDGRQETGLTGFSLYLEEMKILGTRLAVYGTGISTDPSSVKGITAMYILEGDVAFSCPPDKMVDTKAGLCAATVTGIDPVNVLPADLQKIQYTLTGATTGTGKGSVNGKSFNKGITTVTYTRATPAATCSFKVTVNDKETPVISAVSTSPANIWPANDKLVTVTVNYTAKDNCGIKSTVLSVTSNEPDGTGRRYDIPGDIKILSNRQVQLRAESWEKVSKRYYTITITSTDQSGNKSNKSVIVRVSKAGTFSRDAALPLINEEEVAGLQVNVMPNPASNHFTILTNSNSTEKISMRVMTASGSLLEKRTGLPAKGQLQVGDTYLNGVYLAEFFQGTKRIVVRLVKQP